MDAVFGEFDEEKYWQDVKEEALEEGRKEGLEMGREEGREMGREEGREEGHKAGQADAITVMRLIKKGYSDQEISAQVNGCTPEYAAEVRAEMIL